MAKSAKRVNGKSKGNSFERKIANLLSDRFAQYLGIEKGFYRNRDSGSYFGGSNQTRKQTHNTDYAVYGDLVCPREFKFSIECKHYKSPPSFASVLEQSVAQWDTWLTQAQQDSANSGKSLALIIKYNNVDEIVILLGTLTGTDPALTYKNFYIYKLQAFLAQPNDYFFGSE
jgi:fructose-specific component phosphotransferase system IIB-like protein